MFTGNIEIDELKRKEHLISTNLLQLCKTSKIKSQWSFRDYFSHTSPENKLFILKMTNHVIFDSYILQQNFQNKALTYNGATPSIGENWKTVYHLIFRISHKMLQLILENHTLIRWMREYFVKVVVSKEKKYFFTIILIRKHRKILESTFSMNYFT